MDAKTSEWVVDDYLDVSGAYIIRIADSSINDNCKDQLIATVYEKELADLIVDTHNASLEKHV